MVQEKEELKIPDTALLLADIEVTIPCSEARKFEVLSKELKLSLGETLVRCAIEKRDEYMDMFHNNVPDSD